MPATGTEVLPPSELATSDRRAGCGCRNRPRGSDFRRRSEMFCPVIRLGFSSLSGYTVARPPTAM